MDLEGLEFVLLVIFFIIFAIATFVLVGSGLVDSLSYGDSFDAFCCMALLVLLLILDFFIALWLMGVEEI